MRAAGHTSIFFMIHAFRLRKWCREESNDAPAVAEPGDVNDASDRTEGHRGAGSSSFPRESAVWAEPFKFTAAAGPFAGVLNELHVLTS